MPERHVTQLPASLHYKKILAMLNLAGAQLVGQEGSHVKLRRWIGKRVHTIIVPRSKAVPQGTWQSIFRQAGLTMEEVKVLYLGQAAEEAAPASE